GGLVEGAQRQGTQGDAELGARQQQRQFGGVAQSGPGRHARRPGVLEPVPAGRDQRELDGHEEGRRRDENEGRDQHDQRVAHEAGLLLGGQEYGGGAGHRTTSSTTTWSWAGTRRSTRWTLVRRTRSGENSSRTSVSGSATSTRSPTSGRSPDVSMTRPPRVSESASGSVMSRIRSTSSRWVSPESSHPRPTLTGVPAARCGSCSSAISPTISSAMSSIVTTPAKPPYSSTTTAISASSRLRRAATSGSGRDAGTAIGARIRSDTGTRSADSSSSTVSRSWRSTTPMTSSESSPTTGYLVCPEAILDHTAEHVSSARTTSAGERGITAVAAAGAGAGAGDHREFGGRAGEIEHPVEQAAQLRRQLPGLAGLGDDVLEVPSGGRVFLVLDGLDTDRA